MVNQDGEGVRDVGITAGRIAAIGELGQASAGEIIDCKGLHILPGVIDTQVHFREPGADAQGRSGNRLAQRRDGRRHRRLRDAEHQSADGRPRRHFADKIARATHRMHCDFAFFIGGTRENVNDLPELERAPGCAGVKVFMGSSTGALLVEDDEGLRRISQVIRRRAAFHAEDEYRLNERKPLRIEGDPRSHPVWRDETAALMRRSGWSSSRARPASASMCCTSRPSEEIEFLPTTRTSPPSR